MNVSERVWSDLREREWSLLTERELGFPNLRTEILEAFYGDALPTGVDAQGPVPDRIRAKDFCVYRREGGVVKIEAVPSDSLMRLGTGPTARVARRTDFVRRGVYLIGALLDLVPPERRHDVGTWGVHTFRSFTDVVAGPHQDGFEYGCTYVLDRVGDGAVSYLIRDGRTVLEHQLQPGEMLLFKDSEFLHGATALTGEPRRRDALVIQFDAPEDLEAARLGGLL